MAASLKPKRYWLVATKMLGKIPSSQSESLNECAEKSRFHMGDSLVWKYESGKDSVLQVTRDAYLSCNTSNPIEEYKDGNTEMTLDRPGPFYFISGTNGPCEKGHKMIVAVLSPRHRYTGFSPAPSPAEFEGPAVAPTSSATNLKNGFMVVLRILLLGLFLREI
ncbi:early nodulin-like protein 3 [Tripterygium wilfordii]|uniref:Early nodulin-like protein 3 n=1 Tax=Tripterygium wilfordii TaxID=458696 RepID=A0A7J7DAI2_TRIWF|nr:early nodulin-like protein 3 [Tripterygium wilfordii]